MAVDAYIFKLHRRIYARKVRIFGLYLYIAQGEVTHLGFRLAFAESQSLVVGLVVGHVGLGPMKHRLLQSTSISSMTIFTHCAKRLFVAAFEGEELCPGLEFDHCAARAGHIFTVISS